VNQFESTLSESIKPTILEYLPLSNQKEVIFQDQKQIQHFNNIIIQNDLFDFRKKEEFQVTPSFHNIWPINNYNNWQQQKLSFIMENGLTPQKINNYSNTEPLFIRKRMRDTQYH
jgi:hypothetical protein